MVGGTDNHYSQPANPCHRRVVSVVVVFSEWARNHQQQIRNTHEGGKLKANTVGTAKATHCIIELCGERSVVLPFLLWCELTK